MAAEAMYLVRQNKTELERVISAQMLPHFGCINSTLLWDSSQRLGRLLATFGATPRNVWGDSSQRLGRLLATFGATPRNVWGDS